MRRGRSTPGRKALTRLGIPEPRAPSPTSVVGNDQYRAPWPDESFAQYANFRFYDWDTRDCRDPDDWPDQDAALTSSMAYWAKHPGTYHLVHTAGPCALADLERTLGAATMARLLKGYARDHRYGVSTTADFKKTAQSMTDKDLASFWKTHRTR
ncbi:hypothetical protein [Streptomyces sp. NTH33]|uniref:hypothetical protein n=1 Tax=Streptomyces sp. NTH33 TaxID=1735453 RepID=UPI0026C57A97|nr:hypothetical protein [Streptomyces sp. NTH33]